MDKNFILREIKRTAKANGGVPLGKEKFARETGIKDTDWNKLWVRWSDAVRDAGYEPNKLSTAYEPSELLERLVSLMRELKRFPVRAELKMKARQERGFPSHTVFDRFGRKRDLAVAVMKHVEGREEYEDIIAMCRAVLEVAVPEDEDDEGPGDLTVETFGDVYLLKSGRYYKLGRSNAFGRREREIALQLPEKANTVHVIRTDDPVGIEAYWHNRFDARRKNGEWFELTSEDVKAFKRRKFM